MNNYRYERKYEIQLSRSKSIEIFLLLNGFREVFHERIVNSLYYDDFNFGLYFESQNGLSTRKKIRVRYYDGFPSKAIIENKIRKGEQNNKKFFELQNINSNLIPMFNGSGHQNKYIIDVPKSIDNIYHPVVLISYKRKYFISRDSQVRATLDKKITFFKSSTKNNKILIKGKRNLDHDILELKYDSNYYPESSELMKIYNEFNLILSRSSKYCKSISKLYNL